MNESAEDTKYNKVRVMCDNLNLAKGRMTDEYLFTLDATDLVFYKRNIGEVDIKDGFTDGPNDGGIDFIYTDGDTMYLIQGKSTNSLSAEDIKSLFSKMAETVSNFEDKKFDKYSEKIANAYQNAYDALTDDKNIELVLFTKTKINDRMRSELDDFAKSNAMNDYALTIYDKDELEIKDAVLFQDSDLIEEDSIQLYLDNSDSNNILHYGESGIIVNIKANDLKRLYRKYGKTGLFSYNLREHVVQKSVDDGIDNTIKTDRDNFWYYNNGVTIGCEDFEKDGNRIRLYGFSIINGAQTTTKIGESKLVNNDYDFAVVCKIVRAERSISQDSDFISRISEASNSQKPIRQRDLKSNAREQKILQSQCAKNGKYCLSVEIKRGVRPQNYKKVEKWQRVTNEYIGQLLYACIFQHPGPARNAKNSMFSSSKLYKQLFLRKHDYNTLYDLVRIADVFDEYATDFVKATDDLDLIAIIKNGKFTILGCLFYLIKKQKHIVTDASSEELYRDNLSGFLVTDYPGDDLDKNLYKLFDFIIRTLKHLYQENKTTMKITSYSNFFKSEQFYDLVLREFDSLDDWDQEKLASYMKIFVEKKGTT